MIKRIIKFVEDDQPCGKEEACWILESSDEDLVKLLELAYRVRYKHFGNRVKLCSIMNAKSGNCPEDCAFCAQSIWHNTNINCYDMVKEEEILSRYEEASKLPVSFFGVVTSGRTLDKDDIDVLIRVLLFKKENRVKWCASFGTLSFEDLKRLKEAGLTRYHHNIETAPGYFHNVCTTHTIEERLNTVILAKKAGLEVCCGGIIGMGESIEDRVEMALLLQRIKVNSIPLNFLIPIKGTKLENLKPMRPLDMLKTIIMFRLVNPWSEIRVCAGRTMMNELQCMIFYAGATGMMIGHLLTVAGRDLKEDLRMLSDLKVEYEI